MGHYGRRKSGAGSLRLDVGGWACRGLFFERSGANHALELGDQHLPGSQQRDGFLPLCSCQLHQNRAINEMPRDAAAELMQLRVWISLQKDTIHPMHDVLHCPGRHICGVVATIGAASGRGHIQRSAELDDWGPCDHEQTGC